MYDSSARTNNRNPLFRVLRDSQNPITISVL